MILLSTDTPEFPAHSLRLCGPVDAPVMALDEARALHRAERQNTDRYLCAWEDLRSVWYVNHTKDESAREALAESLDRLQRFDSPEALAAFVAAE